MFDNFLIFLHLNNQSYSLRTLFVFLKSVTEELLEDETRVKRKFHTGIFNEFNHDTC